MRGGLSEHHGPITNLFDAPASADERAEFYREHGYVAGVRVLDEPQLAGVPVVPGGQRMGGRFFPLLFDPARDATREHPP